MNREIEEMIEAIKKCSCVYTDCEQECSQCSNEELYDEALNHIARTFYEACYRKSADVAREIFENIEKLLQECSRWDFLAYGKHYYTDDDGKISNGLAELRKKYESEG